MDFKSETALIVSWLAGLTALITGLAVNIPIVAGVSAFASFLSYRFAEKNSLRKSRTTLDLLLFSLTQRSVEVLILATVLLQPNVTRLAGLTVVLTVFMVEILRDEMENIVKAQIRPYAGFEVRSIILALGLLAQGLVDYGAFYAGALVLIINIYEFSRSLRVAF